jgi:hypothetical protein
LGAVIALVSFVRTSPSQRIYAVTVSSLTTRPPSGPPYTTSVGAALPIGGVTQNLDLFGVSLTLLAGRCAAAGSGGQGEHARDQQRGGPRERTGMVCARCLLLSNGYYRY